MYVSVDYLFYPVYYGLTLMHVDNLAPISNKPISVICAMMVNKKRGLCDSDLVGGFLVFFFISVTPLWV